MKALFRSFVLLMLGLTATFAAEEVLSDKSSLTKIMGLYQKVLAGARQSPPAPGSVICIGSSHMQFWKSAPADLAPLTVHNYGVGGSRMSHAADLFVDHLVIPFKPRAVILYEGSNDISAGAKPEEVLAGFRKFHDKLHAALPGTRLYVLSVVPSPGKRFAQIAELRKANALLKAECATRPWMKFIDITEPLIGADGQPRAECFIPGDIHMLPAGYAVWKSVIAPVVVPAEKPYEDAK